MNKKLQVVLTGVLTAFLCCGSFSVSAYTADDIAEKARESGWPETLIQTGYNQWSSGNYSQSDLDETYQSILNYNEQSMEFICNSLGVDPELVKKKMEEDSAEEPEIEPDFQYLSDSEFINLSMEQKQNYLNSLTPEQQAVFLAGLSPEARNSILKQLPAEDKATIMQDYVDTAENLGVHVTVDEITNEEISVTVRNQDGVVIENTGVGVVIDETGISHTIPLCVSGFGILLSVTGFLWISHVSNQKGALPS